MGLPKEDPFTDFDIFGVEFIRSSAALVAVSSSVDQIQRFSVIVVNRNMYGILIVGCSQIGIMNKKNGKASWDIRAIKVFIDLFIEEVEKGGRRGTSLTKPAWTSIEENFTTKTRRVYMRIQLKNKFDTLRKEWQLWDRLLREIGLGWDAERNTVSAPDDWWEKKTEVPGYEKFRERGLQFRAELTQLFGYVATAGPQS
ncbi:L10-interacting MYB domain-containing protein-like [Neltuma alba]|uniref:L10-interacting MYB domain-containing protein-like n=1 Tax=Neltuma alba TaxID=207710 RepID=UPI0010A3CF30|nr:L10-interacting MYB domain-containing protein-like [Prosopis alba]